MVFDGVVIRVIVYFSITNYLQITSSHSYSQSTSNFISTLHNGNPPKHVKATKSADQA
jgi:hypothetical protein